MRLLGVYGTVLGHDVDLMAVQQFIWLVPSQLHIQGGMAVATVASVAVATVAVATLADAVAAGTRIARTLG